MSNKRLKKSIKNVAFGVISELIILMLGLIVPRIVVISYGSEVNGLLSSTTQLLTYLSIFEAGLSSVMCNSLYALFSKNDKANVSSVYTAGEIYYRRTSFYYGACLILVSCIFTFVVKTNIPKLEVFLVILLSGLSSVLVFNFSASIKNVISSDGNYYFISVVNLIVKVLTYGVTIITALLTLNIVTIKAAGLLVTLTQVIAFRAYFKKKYSWIDRKAKPETNGFKQRGYYVIHQVASLMFSCTDVTLLTFLTNLSTVSIYTVYNTIMSAFATLMSTVSSSFTFALGQVFSEDIDEYCKLHDAFKLFYIVLNFVLISVAYYLFVPFINIYMRGADIQYGDSLLALLFCIVSLVNSTRMVDNQLASISWHMKQTMPHVIIEAVLNLMLSVLLVIPFKIYGVLLGTVIAILFRSIVAPFYSERYILHRSIIHGYKHALLNWSLFLSLVFLESKLDIQIVSLLDFILNGVLLVFVFTIVYVIINGLLFRKEFKYIFEHLVRKKTSVELKMKGR